MKIATGEPVRYQNKQYYRKAIINNNYLWLHSCYYIDTFTHFIVSEKFKILNGNENCHLTHYNYKTQYNYISFNNTC